MKLRVIGLECVLAASVLACSSDSSANGAADCVAAGGECIIGSGPCKGTEGPQDCNPDRNPGGAFCCLPCPAGQSPRDGGLPVTGCE